MSSTTTSVSSTSTACAGNGWILPTQDSACGLINHNNASSIMDKCCTPASVEKTDGDCSLYCLAQEQSVGDLTNCLTDNGAGFGDVFCNDKQNATATASVTSTATSTSTSSGSSGTSTESGMATRGGVSKSGMGILGVVLGSVILGAF
ncbi:uncharacterized protein EURHEDRAFT_290624 [Aspergillus ruber CBS 135680]|uniref:Uncharacterized protein n=1 Tax=Aspergillus ruber (strain CBS 135680) TaxID=1388766 RepID=A0A017S0P8_ASPRC|nr:uncharacterized protein EURHEDRAFT_290624 [Aspergillus ruber CBS 135680]EYE90512.1 hypothetical protein EURHEDRAFT_290624 [Aspergillus ruber CBS 135680]